MISEHTSACSQQVRVQWQIVVEESHYTAQRAIPWEGRVERSVWHTLRWCAEQVFGIHWWQQWTKPDGEAQGQMPHLDRFLVNCKLSLSYWFHPTIRCQLQEESLPDSELISLNPGRFCINSERTPPRWRLCDMQKQWESLVALTMVYPFTVCL